MFLNRTLAALAVAGALVLSGCGDDGGDDDARGGQTPGSPTEAATTAGTDAGPEVTPEAFIAEVEAGADSYTTAHVTFTITGLDRTTGTADIDYRTTPASMRQTTHSPLSGTATTITVGDRLYVTGGVGGPPEGMWTVESLSAKARATGVPRTDEQAFLSQVLSYREGITEVEALGEETISGAPAYGYDLTVLRGEVDSLKHSRPREEIEVKVWLDDENRIVRFYLDTGMVISDNVMSDFGKKLKITAPTASKVVGQ